MKPLLFIINGRSQKYRYIITEIENTFNDLPYEIKVTQKIGHAIELANEAISNGYYRIICAGGDGTLNETLNGIMLSLQNHPEINRDGIRLGVIPAGTGNDFVKTVHAPLKIRDLKQSTVEDKHLMVDAGLLEYHNHRDEVEKRWFINVVDVGLGGVVAERISHSSRRLGPFLTYQKAIVQTLLSYRKLPIFVQGDSFTYEGNTMLCVIANAKYFGSGIGIAPDADPTNGTFSVVIAGDISMIDYLKNIGSARKCQHLKHLEIYYKSSLNVEVKGLKQKMPVDMDGEFIGYSPVKASIVHQAIRFYV